MADFNAFSIGIGADITVLQVELQRAKNLLAQFESASKKALTVGELNYSNSQIANLKSSIASLNQEIGKTGRPIGDATQSLVNFSRIAQDAPYGIMGIANNLNPMVESFQRLAATEGGTKNALKAMVSGLTGPAGIGVAIGIVSSLAVAFSKEISNFFKGPTEELNKFREELKKVADDINAIIGKEQTKRTKGILLSELIAGGTPTQQKEALKQLKDLYKDSEDIKNAKLGEDRKYYENLVNLAALQSSAVKNEENFAKQLDLLYAKQIEDRKKRQLELDNLDKGIGVGFFKAGKGAYQKKVDELKSEVNIKYDEIGQSVVKDINRLEKLVRTELEKVTLVPTVDDLGKKEKKPKKDKTLTLEETTILIKQINKTNELLTPNEEEPVDNAIKDAKKSYEEYSKWYDNYLKSNIKRTDKNAAEKKKLTEEEIKENEKLANSYANTITNAVMGMWDAMQSGESVLDALGNMLGRLAEQLVAAALQAAIFAGIMSLITGGVAGGAGGLSFAGYFMKAFGMAEGGIVTGPTHALIGEGNESEAVMPLSKLTGMLNTTFNAGAMNGSATGGGNGQFILRGQDLVLALQRSNYSLNLRRGA
jgi:hypothetical protein